MNTLQLDKNYKPLHVEDKWYQKWEQEKKFSSSPNPHKTPYCIVIPPPNVTGSLHMGHALDNTIQDILIRYKRMKGFETLWVPGVDHAGIATQRVVEKELAKEGLTRWQMGREKFLEKVWEWKEKYGNTIINQLKRLGASCDWDRLRFTMDEGLTGAVRECFVSLYEKGLIYRGKRIVNWCPHCLTALSNLEVEHLEQNKKGFIYYIKYPFRDAEGGVIIATTRPETILADTAVAVNPKDERYKDLIGKTLILPIVGRELPLIADEYVKMDFATGALKITPAHDENDYEVGQRHNLESIVVMDEKGTMNQLAGLYQGLDRMDCRKKIIQDLKEQGFLVKIEDYDVALGTCYRCQTVVEPYLSEQWFVEMKPLTEPGIKAVEQGKIRFFPDRYNEIYLNWMKNIRDWCISRQLWWGHRIPVWQCQDCGHQNAFREDPDKCPNCGSENFLQDDFVLDTWFSSQLWPFSTLGWPQKTPDLEYYYPTDVLVTDRGIIFLWVSRMIMAGLEFMKEIPFPHVLIHATVLTKDGKRMSKSLGTGVDPLLLFDKYGTDATRFGLILMTEQGQDIRFSEERIEQSRNFANKIWNASRYILQFLTESRLNKPIEKENLSLWDRWILSKLNRLVLNCDKNYDEYALDSVGKDIYQFFWDSFCDWYIEISKPILYQEAMTPEKEKTLQIMETVMDRFLRLLHPAMPFISEEIWHFLPGKDEMLITAPFPGEDNRFEDEKAENDFTRIQEVIGKLRNMRADAGLTPKQTAGFIIECENNTIIDIIRESEALIKTLTIADKLEIIPISGKDHPKALSSRSQDCQLFMPLEGLVDIDKEIQRLNKEKTKIEKQMEILEKKCSNEKFLANAKPQLVQQEQTRLLEANEQLKNIQERIQNLTA